MPKPRIYLDTSVLSHLFHTDAPERQGITQALFHESIGGGHYEAFVSSYVIDELTRTPDAALRASLLDIPERFGLGLLPTGAKEVERLASVYFEKGIFQVLKPEDALHVAVATFHEMDLLISWNDRHLANVKKEFLIAAVNQEEGYRKPLRIVTPMEVAAS